MHNLRSVDTLSRELGIDPNWILEQAEAGQIPSQRLRTFDGESAFYFHLDVAANAIAVLVANAMEDASHG